MPAEDWLEKYARVVVRAGLNLQAGQRLLIAGSPIPGGVSLDVAPLVREIASNAYAAGARLVEVLWGDDALLLTRCRRAPRDSFAECSAWMTDVICRHAEADGALLNVRAFGQDVLGGEDPALVGELQQASWRSAGPVSALVARSETNCSVVAAPNVGWARRVFPGLPADEGMTRLWNALARVCYLGADEPLERWRLHVDSLAHRCDRLNGREYTALKFRGPGTDLTVGLPRGHLWRSAQSTSRAGIPFILNLPSEEVFTMPHRNRVDGIVEATRPVTYGGLLIEGLRLRFAEGRLVEVHADRGEDLFRRLLATDEGARRLGEVALVPASSPVAELGLVFYDTLFDENAASHAALGAAYRTTVDGGETMTDEAFQQLGGNRSAIHLDFMIGSAEVDVDGFSQDGAIEPVMRSGCWACG